MIESQHKIKFQKGTTLSTKQRRYIKTLNNGDYRTAEAPNDWITAMTTTDEHQFKPADFRTATTVYYKIKKNNFEPVQIHSRELRSTNPNYKVVINFLNKISSQKLCVSNSYSTGTETNKAFCKHYYTNKCNDLTYIHLKKTKKQKVQLNYKPILKKHTKVMQPIRVNRIKRLKSLYLRLQISANKESTIKIIPALEYIQPKTGDFKATQRAIKSLLIYKEKTFISQPYKYGRIYHSLNMLDSDIRQFLINKETKETYKSIDLTHCQIAFLINLLKESSQVINLKEIMKKTRIYDVIAKYSGRAVNRVKKSAMTFLFGSGEYENTISRYFKDNFKEVYNQIVELKLIPKPLWLRLSIAETSFMFECYKQIKGTKICIHDELMVLESEYENAIAIFQKMINKHNLPTFIKMV
jgi:hypothetical protein